MFSKLALDTPDLTSIWLSFCNSPQMSRNHPQDLLSFWSPLNLLSIPPLQFNNKHTYQHEFPQVSSQMLSSLHLVLHISKSLLHSKANSHHLCFLPMSDPSFCVCFLFLLGPFFLKCYFRCILYLIFIVIRYRILF